MNSDQKKPGWIKSSILRILLVVVPVCIVCVSAVNLIANRIEHDAQLRNEEKIQTWFGLTAPTPSRLDARYQDADDDLVADVPEEGLRISPETLTFSYIAGTYAVDEIERWRDFVEHLSRKTGKRVEPVAYASIQDQLGALLGGKLHVTGFNTGAVPTAVSECGFVPVCTVGRQDGLFGSSMRFIVPERSSIRSVDDLRGRTMTFTTADSNSGCKAAIIVLRDHNMLPQRDYKWKFSGGHQESIKGIADGQYEVAAISDDLWQRALSSGEVGEEKIRTIYESERFPTATLGYAYNLSRELAAMVRGAFFEYSLKDSDLKEQFGPDAARFVPVIYKQDFALVRRINDAFRKTPAMTPAK